MLEENFNRASEDVAAYQRFLNSRRSQIEEEKNLLCFAERFHSKIKQEKQRTTKALNDTRGRNDRMQVFYLLAIFELYVEQNVGVNFKLNSVYRNIMMLV